MNRKLKKLCTVAMTLAITATSAMNMSVSAWDIKISHLSDYTIVEDKGMLRHDGDGDEGYKMLYQDNCLYRAEPFLGSLRFVLSEDVNYEEVNERIIEIFEEFYPDNYLGVSEVPTGENPPATGSNEYLEYRENYRKNYKPNLKSYTEDGVTTYTLIANVNVRRLDDEKVAEARKYSKAFMKKLNDEKLISAFYDFGEVYMAIEPIRSWLLYSKKKDIDVINNYIKENNIDCTLEDFDDHHYILKSNDDDRLKSFLIAVDIYEATSIEIEPINTADNAPTSIVYGKNALEYLTKAGNANEDETVDIRDAAFIARKVAQRKVEELPKWADYNNDNKLDILDAAAIAKDVARRILK